MFRNINSRPINQNRYGYIRRIGEDCLPGMPDDGDWRSRRNVAFFGRPSGRSPQWPFSGPAAQNVRRASASQIYGIDRMHPNNRVHSFMSRSQITFRSYLNSRYGNAILTMFRRLDSLTLKFVSVSESLTFLCRCRSAKIRPAGLRLRDPCGSQRSGRIIQKATEGLLRERIEYHHKEKKQLQSTLLRMEDNLRGSMAREDWERMKKSVDNLASSRRKAIRERQKNKFNMLRQQDVRSAPSINLNRIVVNRSNRQLSRAEEDLLAKGLNYAVAPLRVPVKEIVTGLECAASFVPQEIRTEFRNELATALKKVRNPSPNLSPKEFHAIKALRSDRNIVILPADKGNSTVVMNRKEYDERSLRLFQTARNSRRFGSRVR